LLKQRQFEPAIQLLQRRLADTSNAPYDRASLLLALGNLHYSSHRYAEALGLYTEGLRVAESHNLTTLLPLVSWSRMNVYLRMGDRAAARHSAEASLHLPASRVQPAAYIFAAQFENDLARAQTLCIRGIRESNAAGNHSTEAYGWNVLGRLYMASKKPELAEQAFIESFRIRKLLLEDDGIAGSLLYLAELHIRQGQVGSADGLLDAAARRYDQGDGFITETALHAARARAQLQRGNHKAAFEEFERCVAAVRRMRYNILPADEMQLSAESQHERLFRLYIETAMTLFHQTHAERFVAAAFLAAEEHRQVAYRRVLATGYAFPPEYYTVLGAYRRTLARSLNAPQDENQVRQVQQLARQLADIESRLGLKIYGGEDSHQKNEKSTSADVLSRLQKKLKDNEAVLSFVVGPERSYLWTLTRNRIAASELPGEEKLAAQVSKFSGWIKGNHSTLRADGERLFRDLYKGIPEDVWGKSSWLIVPDGALLKLPFAALPGHRHDGFLIETHTLRVLPSAMMLLEESAPVPAEKPEFVGFGDAVYNSADSRYAGEVADAGSQLGRLPASARELRMSAAAFALDPKPELYMGRDFKREQVRSAFTSAPAVLHVAGHVVQHPKDPAQVLIALGLTNTGEQEYLDPREISTWRSGTGLVMLSGCGSGSGSELPGLGLIGLSRAWLIAGAQTVTATYWPIEDTDSGLVTNLYSTLGRETLPLKSSTVAHSLRAAQLSAIRQGGWRAQPSYWAGFFVVGKD
jgi:CHAT domain-containing protein